ncbi:HNH endonuclease family protein [Amycolatopsis acidiphila]|uniref:HNH endonuclease n=1 Tax=Amycolatopsis acidiphila TaxID=715473 RepID=A0A558AGV4_9PSEU|nr:HNH endonuclease family protein [Amycolatopsis acidiphila]TVT23499.1 HNH endonuclease [Amycolatopsis acidiphila]UIJ59959.1 HNH endonuclease family protein [Amycolatopsis acidiphila]
MPGSRSLRRTLTVVVASVAVTAGFTGSALATPPGIPTESTAHTELAALTVKADGSQDGYSRDKFPHWIDQGNSCDTREVVLKRDGTGVATGSDCYPTSGSWYSPYDGATWTAASDVDIDHVVPLADAWRTGASSWTTAQRQAYANDLSDPQLIAVTDNVNQSKGDASPDTWKPPLTSYWCTYAEMWIKVKYTWKLSVNSAEKSALTDMLGRC